MRIVAIYGYPQQTHRIAVSELRLFLQKLCSENKQHKEDVHLTSLVYDVKAYGNDCPDYTVVVYKTLKESTAKDIFQAAIMIHRKNADLRLIIHDPGKKT